MRIRRVEGGGVLLEPIYATTDEWFAAMDAVATDDSFMADGRQQPPMPPPVDWFD